MCLFKMQSLACDKINTKARQKWLSLENEKGPKEKRKAILSGPWSKLFFDIKRVIFFPSSVIKYK